MTDLVQLLDELHAAGKMHGFSLWPSQGGYQANLAMSGNSWRIRFGDTPSDAIRQVLDFENAELDPPREPEMLAPPLVDEPDLPPIDDAGIFD